MQSGHTNATFDELCNSTNCTVNDGYPSAAQYFADYEKYLLSIGGVLNKAEIFSSEVLQNMTGQIQNMVDNEDIKQTLNISNEWGMNRKPELTAAPVDSKQVLDSLFNAIE